MTVFIVIIHIIVCIALILIVLLQTGKGADMGAVFGSASSQTLFGSTGATTFLGKLTTVAAIIFMLTSLSLAYISAKGGGGEGSVVSDVKPAAQQTQPAVPPQTPTAPVQDQAPAPAETPQPPATPPQSQ